MTNVLDSYLDPAFRYSFTQGPDVVRSLEDALQNGINCISLAHLALQDLFGVQLPSRLHCAEMYLDKTRFTHVDGIEMLQRGDLVWFGIEEAPIEPDEFVPVYDNGALTNWRDFPIKHTAISTGQQNLEGDPLLLHSTHLEGTNVVWPLGKFAKYKRYEKLHGITRLVVADPAA